ncbi:MAG: arsenate reductase (glutaredoxin) [Gammaproteobacteria bacterium]|nr:arsenate reductase (glutaredoxin) [Gammaproteobacteria bacterium]
MSVIIYHNPRCSKSRKALELLEQHQQQPQVIEYLKTPPDAQTLKAILAKLGITARELLRSKEDEYQLAGLDDLTLSEEDIIEAMIKYPKLIERPIVIIDGKAAIGRPPENVLSLLEK